MCNEAGTVAAAQHKVAFLKMESPVQTGSNANSCIPVVRQGTLGENPQIRSLGPTRIGEGLFRKNAISRRDELYLTEGYTSCRQGFNTVTSSRAVHAVCCTTVDAIVFTS